MKQMGRRVAVRRRVAPLVFYDDAGAHAGMLRASLIMLDSEFTCSASLVRSSWGDLPAGRAVVSVLRTSAIAERFSSRTSARARERSRSRAGALAS